MKHSIISKFLSCIGILSSVLSGTNCNAILQTSTTTHGLADSSDPLPFVVFANNDSIENTTNGPTIQSLIRAGNYTSGLNYANEFEIENGLIKPLNQTNKNVTIVVMGKSGSGISSTIRNILKQPTLPKTTEKFLVEEYSTPTSENSFLKFVDVEGFVDGKTPEQDAKTLATLKSYLFDLNQIHGETPAIFLIVSNFDDNRYIGSQSTFIQTVKRAQILQTVLYDQVKHNNIFLLTRLMSETRDLQRRPKSKIKSIQSTIANYTRFKEPIYVTVGENMPDPGIVNSRDGYARLPNKETYPKNVLDLMLNITSKTGFETASEVIEAFRNNRSAYLPPSARGYPNNTNSKDINEMLSLIQFTTYDVEETEVNQALLEAYEMIQDPKERKQLQNLVPMLQIYLQNTNIKLKSQLPIRTLDRVKFFQSLPAGLEAATQTLLKKFTSNSMPEFVQPPLVGSSYDVTTDEAIPSMSPLQPDRLLPSATGYLLPSYIICSKIIPQTSRDHTWSVRKFEDYVKQRIAYLDFPEREMHFNISSFNGKIKAGFNLIPEPGEVPSLSTVREIRKFIFQLNLDKVNLSDEFLNASSDLSPLVLSNRDSVAQWNQYFSRFGTHVVSSAFVGGRIEGLVVDQGIHNLTSSGRIVLQKEVVDFQSIQITNKPTYQFFGGERSADLAQVYQTALESRATMLADWMESVSYDPIALDYELQLLPISELLRKENETLASEIDGSAKTFLAGKLVYTRARKNSTGKVPRPRATSTPSSNQPVENYGAVKPTQWPIAGRPESQPHQGYENTASLSTQHPLIDDEMAYKSSLSPQTSENSNFATLNCTPLYALQSPFESTISSSNSSESSYSEAEMVLEALRKQELHHKFLLCKIEKERLETEAREKVRKIYEQEARKQISERGLQQQEVVKKELEILRERAAENFAHEMEKIRREEEEDLKRLDRLSELEAIQHEAIRNKTEEMIKRFQAKNNESTTSDGKSFQEGLKAGAANLILTLKISGVGSK